MADNCKLCRIALENVSVVRGGQTLLQDVSMHIHCGQLTVLIGQNGAGKTKLIRALLGDRETSSSGTKTEKSDGSVNIWDGSLVIFLIGITFCAVFVKTSVDVTSIPAASRVLTLTFKSNSSVISVCRVSIFKR